MPRRLLATLSLLVALVACKQAQVEITSDPSDANVYVDGNYAGRTPVTVYVKPDTSTSYRVVAQEPYGDYDLYKPYEGTFSASQPATISVWLDRTTGEEQAAERSAAEQKRQKEAEEAERRRQQREAEELQRRQEAEAAARRRKLDQAVFIIENWNWTRDRYGSTVEGLVTNNTSAVIRYGQAHVRFFDASSNFLSNDWTYLEFKALAPGQSTTFKLYPDDNPRYKSAQLWLVVDDTPVTTIRRSEANALQ